MPIDSPHRSFYDLARADEVGSSLRCPFAHHHNQESSSPKVPLETDADIDAISKLERHADTSLIEKFCDKKQSLDNTSRHEMPDPIYQQSCPHVEDEDIHAVMPPEHKALAEGYTGKTCPFLDHNASLNDDTETVTATVPPSQIVGAGYGTRDQITRERIISTSFQRPSKDLRLQPNAPNPSEKLSDNEGRCPIRENAQPINAFSQEMIVTQQPTPTSNKSNCNITTPSNQNASEARIKMDTVLLAQQQAMDAIKQAEQQVIQAQKHLTLMQKKKESVDSILASTTEELTDALLEEDCPWNNMYKQLVEFKQQYGHCDVKRHWSKEEKNKHPDMAMLGAWVGKTRQEGRRTLDDPHRLESYKILALQRLGFDWAPRDNAWMQNYEKIKLYIQHNPGKLPQRRKDPLGTWCNGQIVEYNKFMSGDKKAYITQKKIDMLSEIGFVWDRASNTWSQRYEALKEFHAVHGHCRLPKSYKDQVLYRWVTKERIKYRNNLKQEKPCHTDEQKNLLDRIGFMDGNRIKARTTNTAAGSTTNISGSKRKADCDSSDDASVQGV